MKAQLKNTAVALAMVMASVQANALVLSPVRCAGDNLPQWGKDLNGDANAPIGGTARGRNAWWLICDPVKYKTVNDNYDILGIDSEFDPTANHNAGVLTRWYPTFGVKHAPKPGSRGEVDFDRPGNWTAPTSPPPSAGDSFCLMAPGYTHVGMCASGCLTPEQDIASENDYIAIGKLEDVQNPTVMVPALDGSNAKAESLPVERFIKDGTPAAQKIVVITTQSGVQVKASLNHPFLTQDFTMRRADKLTNADSLIKADGFQDAIVKVETQDYFGKLHNLTVATSDLQKSIYVVRGYISGDKKHQDLQLSDVNRKIMRDLVK